MNKPQTAHTLSHTKQKEFPVNYIFLDTETTIQKQADNIRLHVLKLGIAQYHKRDKANQLHLEDEITIQHVNDFTRWLMSKVRDRNHYYLIAHNIVYDASILDLFRLLPIHGFKLESLYSKGQVTIVRFVRGTIKITLLDNGNLFAGSLDRWGKIFAFPKLAIDFQTCTIPELTTYCRRDVEIMVRCWQEWIDFSQVNHTVGFRETVASSAFGTWRLRFMPDNVYVHKTQAVLDLERAAYHGGRVEVFQQGLQWADHYYYLDINNMYGHVMRAFEYPLGLQGYSDKITLRRMIEYVKRYAVIAHVNLTVDKPVFLHKVNGHAAYPIGTYDETLTTQEIVYALEHGYINRVHACAWYSKRDLFSRYVDEFYNLRMTYKQAGNVGFEQICKLFINGLYGKFGQTGMKQFIIGRSEPWDIWTENIIHAQTGKRGQRVSIGGVVYDQLHEGESYHSIPAIAAHITANARMHLFGLMEKAGLENVSYCDTDSVIVNSLGYYNLESEVDDLKLGKLKIELHSPWVNIHAPKDYAMQGRSKIKGIRANAVQVDDNTYLHEQWVKMAGLIRSGFEGGYTSKIITKHQARLITSGTLTPSGRVLPFDLD